MKRAASEATEASENASGERHEPRARVRGRFGPADDRAPSEDDGGVLGDPEGHPLAGVDGVLAALDDDL